MIKVLSIFGTRPEVIKMAPILTALSNNEHITSVICSTGQHREMLQPLLKIFNIVADYNLETMRPGQSLSELTANLINALDPVIQSVKPQWILAQGDTTTVMVASIVAFYNRVAFAHVEAGLRTYDKLQPYPEEINRRISDLIADLYFAPTPLARTNLLQEHVLPSKICVSGNTIVDALQYIAKQPFHWETSGLGQIPANKKVVLITIHRRENFGDTFRELCRAIQNLARGFPSVYFVYPVHLNPNLGRTAREMLSDFNNIILTEPLDYPSLIQLMKRSTLILTDSGGIQEEAPSFHVPTLVLRETTERPEGINAGVARLVGTDPQRIVAEASTLLSNEASRQAMTAKESPYGDGKAAERIVSRILGNPVNEFVSRLDKAPNGPLTSQEHDPN